MAFEGQNAFGVREHVIRTLQFEMGGNGDHDRPSDIGVIGVVERRADIRKPFMGMVRNIGDFSFEFQVQGSDDAGVSDTFANAIAYLEMVSAPVDGDTVVVNDGTNALTFEFDDDGTVGGGNIPVVLTTGSSMDAMESFVVAVMQQWRDRTIGLSAEITSRHFTYSFPENPTAILTRNLSGAVAITVTPSGGFMTVTGASNGSDPLDFQHYGSDGTEVTVSTLLIPPGSAVQFEVREVDEKYLRFMAVPASAALLNPYGVGLSAAHLEIAYYYGMMERYERSNATTIPRLPN